MITCKKTPAGWLATHNTVSHIHEYGLTESAARIKAEAKLKQFERAQLSVRLFESVRRQR